MLLARTSVSAIFEGCINEIGAFFIYYTSREVHTLRSGDVKNKGIVYSPFSVFVCI